jgi:hypothetical protein
MSEQFDDLFDGGLDSKLDFLNDKKSISADGIYRIDMSKVQDKKKGYKSVIRFLPNFTKDEKVGQSAIEKITHYVDIKNAKERATKEGKTIVLPKGGFGTGLAALATKAPETFAYLNKRLQEEFGFNNTTGELAALESQPSTVETPIVEITPTEPITLTSASGIEFDIEIDEDDYSITTAEDLEKSVSLQDKVNTLITEGKATKFCK